MATVKGEADNKLIRDLTKGVELDDGPAKADFAQIIDVWQGRSIIRVELHEDGSVEVLSWGNVVDVAKL